MTRSDLILAVHHAVAEDRLLPSHSQPSALIQKMHRKIENVYKLLFELENFKSDSPAINEMTQALAKNIRAALES